MVIKMPYYVRQPDGTYKEMIDDAVISSTSEITRTNKIWFDLNSEKPRIYNPNTQNWELVQDIALIERIARKEAIQKSIALGGD